MGQCMGYTPMALQKVTSNTLNILTTQNNYKFQKFPHLPTALLHDAYCWMPFWGHVASLKTT